MTPEEKAAAEAAAAAENDKLELTEDQQTKVNAQIKARLARQEKQLTDKFTADKTALEAKLADLEAKITEFAAATPKENGDEEDEKIVAMRLQQKQLLEAEQAKTKAFERKNVDLENKYKELETRFNSTLKSSAIHKAMTGLGFHNPEQIEKLTTDSIVYDEGMKTYVVMENGVTKENNSLEPMTLNEYFSEYAQKNPWFVNAEVANGAGSQHNQGKPTGSIKKKSDFKSLKEKADWITANGPEAFEALPL